MYYGSRRYAWDISQRLFLEYLSMHLINNKFDSIEHRRLETILYLPTSKRILILSGFEPHLIPIYRTIEKHN